MDTYIMWIMGCSAAFWIGKIVGQHLGTYRVLLALSKDPDTMSKFIKDLKKLEEVEKQLVISSPTDSIEMEIEEVNGMIYAYNKVTGQFLAQAHDVQQAARIAAQRFPGQKFWHPSMDKDTQTV